MLMRALLLLLFSACSQANWQVIDNLGDQYLSAKPTRIVALNWDLAENLMELGVTPVGVPNIKDYHTWVVSPRLPDSVTELGTRSEPNLALLAALKPDLILTATPQRDLLPRLRQIAPVLYYETYQLDRNAAEAAIGNFRLLARSLGKQQLAEHKLAMMQQRFDDWRHQLQQAYGGAQAVMPMRFANTTSVFLYGSNSTTIYALEQLGMEAAITVPAGPWGIVQKRLLELQRVGDGYVLYFLPFADEAKLAEARLWQAMPFVRAGRFNSVESVWNYGGAMSIERIGLGMFTSLMEIAPQ